MNPTKISFGFNKKITTKNLKESINKKGFSDSTKDLDKNSPTIINDIKDIHRKRSENVEIAYSISPLENNRDGIYGKLKQKLSKNGMQTDVEASSSKPMTLDERAVKELSEECLKRVENILDSNHTIANIPVKEGNSLGTAVAPSLDDYEDMPIGSFGTALLHGLGSKKGEGIGKDRRIVAMVDPSNRTFGLADKVTTKEDVEEEEILLKEGSYVIISGGRNKGKYGTVQSVDIDHCLVKVARDQSIIRVIEQHIRAVSSKEFKDSSRVVNKEMYDQYKEEQENVKTEQLQQKGNDDLPASNRDVQCSKRANSRENSCEPRDLSLTKYRKSRSWLIEGLRVKIVGKSFRKGRYYKEKVVIKSVNGKDRCCCLTDSQELVENVYEEDLETVIPRQMSACVLIVHGSSKGQKGTLLKNEKEEQEVTVQLRDKSVRKGYDSVCEYVEV